MFDEIETQAIEHFVGQAKTVTPEIRTKVIANMNKFLDGKELASFKGNKISREVMRETIRQIEAL